MTKSKIFLILCLSFIGGIFIDSLISVPLLLMLGFLILGILLISIPPSLNLIKRAGLAMAGFCLLILVGGIWCHQSAELKITNNELKKYNDLNQKISLIGKVVREPDIRESNAKLTVKPEKIDGKILVTTNRYPRYQYGDKLKITGRLKTPHVFKDFNYKNYLAKDGIYSVIYYPKIELVAEEQGNFIYSKILGVKDKLRQSINRNLSPPQSSILEAVILGDKRGISEDWKQKLNLAGVRHITAVSGMHVAILSSILMTLLLGLGLWRQQAFYFSIILIALFVVMTGFQPSAVRAGIMGGLFLLAQYLGRMKSGIQAIVFAAAVMLIINPLLLRLDVGFQLSFLAMVGIIYLLPIFQNWIYKFSAKIPNFLNSKDILAMTLSAQIFTLPILIYNFGYFSLVSVLTNILIVPILPAVVGLGFIFAIFGLIWQPLGWVLSLPAWLLLTYLAKIVDFFSSLSFSHIAIGSVHWIWLVAAYLILGFLTWKLNQRFTRPTFLR